MRKVLSTVLFVLIGSLFLVTAQATIQGDYTWEEYTLTVQEIDEKPMFAPGGMTDDQRPVAIGFRVPEAIIATSSLTTMLYEQAKLVNVAGDHFAAGSAMTKNNEPIITLLFAIPKEAKIEDMTLEFSTQSVILAKYVGDWKGSADGIDLSFTIREDGTGQYTYTRSGYTESYAVTLTASSDSFEVDIPAGNSSYIAACEGTYAFVDGKLMLDVTTTFVAGNKMEYSISCKRVKE